MRTGKGARCGNRRKENKMAKEFTVPTDAPNSPGSVSIIDRMADNCGRSLDSNCGSISCCQCIFYVQTQGMRTRIMKNVKNNF